MRLSVDWCSAAHSQPRRCLLLLRQVRPSNQLPVIAVQPALRVTNNLQFHLCGMPGDAVMMNTDTAPFVTVVVKAPNCSSDAVGHFD
jgi:hypothetical protein